MSSAAQFHANRQNAQSSTGPTTDAGKARSSQNAFRHGLASRQLMIPGEDPTQYEALLAGLYADHQPQTITESILVYNMALSHWLMLRAIRFVADILSNPETAGNNTSAFTRYQISNERMFWKSFDTLRKLKKERAEAEAESEASAPNPAPPTSNGFVSQPAPAPVQSAPKPPSEPHPMWKKPANLAPVTPAPKRKRF